MNWKKKLETNLALFYFTCYGKFWDCVFQFSPHGIIWALKWRRRFGIAAKRLEDAANENSCIYFFWSLFRFKKVYLGKFYVFLTVHLNVIA